MNAVFEGSCGVSGVFPMRNAKDFGSWRKGAHCRSYIARNARDCDVYVAPNLLSFLFRQGTDGAEAGGPPDIEITMKDLLAQPGVKGYAVFNESGSCVLPLCGVYPGLARDARACWIVFAGIPIRWSTTGFGISAANGAAIPPEITHYAALISDLTVKCKSSCKRLFRDDVRGLLQTFTSIFCNGCAAVFSLGARVSGVGVLPSPNARARNHRCAMSVLRVVLWAWRSFISIFVLRPVQRRRARWLSCRASPDRRRMALRQLPLLKGPQKPKSDSWEMSLAFAVFVCVCPRSILFVVWKIPLVLFLLHNAQPIFFVAHSGTTSDPVSNCW
jgi:hypothetical protein